MSHEGFVRFEPYSDLVKFASDSVDEAWAERIMEFLEEPQRIGFLNELYRVLKPGSQCAVDILHWCNPAASDLPLPLIKEGDWFLWNREFRLKHFPVTDISQNPDGYSCDFDFGYGYDLASHLDYRCETYRTEAWQADLRATEDFQGSAILSYQGFLSKRP